MYINHDASRYAVGFYRELVAYHSKSNTGPIFQQSVEIETIHGCTLRSGSVMTAVLLLLLLLSLSSSSSWTAGSVKLPGMWDLQW